MAQHLSKMDDGHFILESDEEYKKRTGGKLGCGSIILIAIVIIFMYFNDDEDKNSNDTESPAKTEQVTSKQSVNTSTSSTTEKCATKDVVPTTIESSKTIQYEDIEEISEPEPTSASPMKIETTIESPEEETIVETIDTKESKAEIREAEKKVNELFASIKRACQQKDVESAQLAFAEMEKIHSSTPSQKIQSKITSASKLIEKAKR